jgi:hypothetical protein
MVAVLGIDVHGDRSQSAELVREADENLILPADILCRALTQKLAPAVPLVAQVVDPGADHPASPSEPLRHITEAQAVASEYLATATGPEISALLDQYPAVPRELDAVMLSRGVRSVGVRTLSPEQRRAMRVAFWGTVRPPEIVR